MNHQNEPLIPRLTAILSLLSVGENCQCERCQAARMLAKVIEELKGKDDET